MANDFFVVSPCTMQSEHSCVCPNDDTSYPVLVNEEVDGTTISVKLFEKEFDTDEIALLKDLNGFSA